MHQFGKQKSLLKKLQDFSSLMSKTAVQFAFQSFKSDNAFSPIHYIHNLDNVLGKID